MIKLDQKHQQILLILLKGNTLSSSQIHAQLLLIKQEVALVTVKRELSHLLGEKLITAQGSGRSRTYHIGELGRIFSAVDAKEYCTIEPDRRFGLENFNFNLLPAWPLEIFNTSERLQLEQTTKEYRHRTANLPPTIEKKELERLIIELSWKSSKIEGNTYTLLDTEKLILENTPAQGHDPKEAVMILNHKNAFSFIRDNAQIFKNLKQPYFEQIHSLLINGLNVGKGLRKKPVGVTGSKYRPLDNIYHIQEAIDNLVATINKVKTPFDKALLALLGISYIQPFEDGNKRTARLTADAILLAHHCAPLSYRSLDENEYREAMLVFYELNSAMPFKKIFATQYEFAAKNYTVK